MDFTQIKAELKERIATTRNPLKKLYYWVLGWAYSKYGVWALIFTAFSESSFFPVAPDSLILPMSLSRPKRAFYYAGLAAVFSVLGGMLGYAIGLWLMKSIGVKLLTLYGAMDKFNEIARLYNKYDAVAVAAAGFTPIPYKVFTIAAGACKINFLVFVIASAASRSARFFLEAALMYFFGEPAKIFIEKYFNWIILATFIAGVVGFVVVKYAIK